MSHKVLINGTAYTVAGGDTLASGTKYQLGGGKTLINGAAYDIGFSMPVQVQVTTENKSANRWGGIYINGTQVFEGNFELERGDIVVLECAGSINSRATISVDGVIVASKPDTEQKRVQYNYTVDKDCVIKLIRKVSGASFPASWADIVVTTQ